MLLLSLDTTSREGSCALMRDGLVLHEQPGDSSREQAERLPGELAALLERESVALREIDCFAVATGPGSFTGLRVGIATVQGLAMATGKPLIGVSAFDALAAIGGSGEVPDPDPPHVRAAGAVLPDVGGVPRPSTLREPQGRPEPGRGTTRSGRPDRAEGRSGAAGMHIATWIDAWRGEVFSAVFENGREVETPTVARPDDLLGRRMGEPTVFTGDGAALYQARIRAVLGGAARFTDPVAPLLAAVIASLAAERFRAGERPPPHAIRPIYVRRSDAELARDRQQA